jgi:hypothetical protein
VNYVIKRNISNKNCYKLDRGYKKRKIFIQFFIEYLNNSILKANSSDFFYFYTNDISTANLVENSIWTLVSITNSTESPFDRFQYYEDYSDYTIDVDTSHVQHHVAETTSLFYDELHIP